MYYGNIKKYDVANGEGVRVTLFISGCRIHCPGCFQAETWDFRYGQEYTEETQKEVLDAMDSEFIAGLTVLGGEPFEPENQRVVVNPDEGREGAISGQEHLVLVRLPV